MAAEVVNGDAVASGRSLLRSCVVEAVATPVGPHLALALEEVMHRDDLSAREWVEITAAWTKVESYAAAGKLTGVAQVDQAMSSTTDGGSLAAPGRTDPVRRAADELAPALRISPRTASHLVALTRRLSEAPAGFDALADGRLHYAQLRVLDHVTRDLPATSRTALEIVALKWAARRTAQQLHADLAAEAVRVDPSHAAAAVEHGVAERDVTFRPSPLPGCRRLVADTPMIPGTAAWLAINAAARNAKKAGVRPDGTPEDRTLAQLRADIHFALLSGQGDPLGGHVPTPEELAHLAEVQVVVSADTLLPPDDGDGDGGGDGLGSGPGGGCLPAHLPGVGPIAPATVREVARRAPWRRLVADPTTGALLSMDDTVHEPPDADTTSLDAVVALAADPRWQRILADPVTAQRLGDEGRYRPSERMRRYVHARDVTCVGPACHHPATGTQIDHTVNHGHRDVMGVLGTTSAGNLGSLCDRWHNAKTHGGWRLRQPSPGTFEWTSPTGRVYVRPARPLVPGWRHRPRERPPPSAESG